MKNNLFSELKKTLELLRRYASLEYSYYKLTAAEKLTLLAGAVAVSAVVTLLAAMMMMLLLLSSAEFFKNFMSPTFAYLSSAGIFFVLIMVVILFKRVLILNPISRFLTKLMFGNHSAKSKPQS